MKPRLWRWQQGVAHAVSFQLPVTTVRDSGGKDGSTRNSTGKGTYIPVEDVPPLTVTVVENDGRIRNSTGKGTCIYLWKMSCLQLYRDTVVENVDSSTRNSTDKGHAFLMEDVLCLQLHRG